MVAKRTLSKEEKQKKNKRDLEVACVKMVKKQALNLLPYLALSTNELNLSEELFELKRDDRLIDENIDAFYHRIPQDVESQQYSKYNCLLKAVSTILADLQVIISLAAEDLDLSDDKNVREVIRRLPNHSATYNFLSMSFIFPETMLSSAQLKEKIESLPKSEGVDFKKQIEELKKYIKTQNEYTNTSLLNKTTEIQKQLRGLLPDSLIKDIESVKNDFRQMRETANQNIEQGIAGEIENKLSELSTIVGNVKDGLKIKEEDIRAINAVVDRIISRTESLTELLNNNNASSQELLKYLRELNLVKHFSELKASLEVLTNQAKSIVGVMNPEPMGEDEMLQLLRLHFGITKEQSDHIIEKVKTQDTIA